VLSVLIGTSNHPFAYAARDPEFAGLEMEARV
jgi:hypothetical protein